MQLSATKSSDNITVSTGGKVATAGGGGGGGRSSGDHGPGKKHKNKGLVTQKGQGAEGGVTPTTTTLHWHAHAVTALALSPDGRYLFSGGEEGVLVIWQLATGIKAFVPRLGAPITFLAPSLREPRVAATASDNSVRIINTSSQREDWEFRSLFIPQGW